MRRRSSGVARDVAVTALTNPSEFCATRLRLRGVFHRASATRSAFLRYPRRRAPATSRAIAESSGSENRDAQ